MYTLELYQDALNKVISVGKSTHCSVSEIIKNLEDTHDECKSKKLIPTRYSSLNNQLPKIDTLSMKNIEEIDTYHKNIDEYCAKLKDYIYKKLHGREETIQSIKFSGILSTTIINFIKSESGLLTLPKSKQDKLWNKVMADSSTSYVNIYYELVDLVDLVK